MEARRAGVSNDEYMESGRADRALLDGLDAAVDRLTTDFGQWDTPWGEITRFQRLTGDIVQPFQKTFFSPGFGMLRDRFGTHWKISVAAAPG